MLIGPAAGEGFLLLADKESAVFPKVTTLMFIGEVLLLFTLTTVVVAVLALGNDYELGTVRAILSRGVPRHQFLLAKIAATVIAALANGLAYMTSGVLAASLAHLAYSDVPLAEAAGPNLVWRALGCVCPLPEARATGPHRHGRSPSCSSTAARSRWQPFSFSVARM